MIIKTNFIDYSTRRHYDKKVDYLRTKATNLTDNVRVLKF